MLLGFVLFNSVVLSANAPALQPALPEIRYSAENEEHLKSIVDKFGVEIKSLRLSAVGYMLDFRHKVVDAKKAAYLHSYKIQPYVWDPKANISVVPPSTKVGILRQGKNDAREGNIYTTMFANPGRRFKRGDKVTLVIGDLVIEDMEIE
ncbi:MAG: hypothetical protein DBP03_04790 [gamma proteobacterium symbiont of Ctena orbiculata]|nr:MAG: hypothetical protein DBP03_04790 [gamma proteobacterium symbiont of Ctena orbiculata]PUB79393.1 MAG: hypothetical protein DBO99_04580 [gamma proteobacterium symbiont of Ctena orbiculata]